MSSANLSPRKIRAKWIAPISSPPIENGMLVLDGQSILEVGEFNHEIDVEDLGDSVILPGWVNCHTHLEFSNLAKPLGVEGTPITDWIPDVISERFSRGETESSPVEQGLEMCHQTGTALVGEIATSVEDMDAYQNSQLHGSVFFERLGNDAARVDEIKAPASDWLNESCVSNWFRGLSPHAPYSISPELFEQLLGLAKNNESQIAMHVGETREELEWLNHRSGPFEELLDSLGAVPNLPLDWNMDRVVELLCSLERSILVHGNYLTEEQLDVVTGSNSSIVYCPRTHKFFGHDEYPISSIRKRGILLGIGTDSLASNPDLDMLGEAQLLRRQFPELDSQTIIEMATINGAKILGRENRFGSIEVGKASQLIQFELNGEANALEAVLDGSAKFVGWV